MLWRVRTTLADRPGALARLATSCGEAGANILALQIFPGVHAVTDELVLSTPDEWGTADVAAIVEDAGGGEVTVATCTPHALVDGPTNYLLAARHVVEDPASIEVALTELLDGVEPGDTIAPLLNELVVPVGDTSVTVRRTAPFTATEHARATAFAVLVSSLLEAEATGTALSDETDPVPELDAEPVYRLASAGDAMALVRMGQRCSAGTLTARFGIPLGGLSPRLARRLLAEGPALVVQVGHEIVALGNLAPGEPAEVALLVEDGWQNRGVGTRLLGLAARLAKARGAAELRLSAEAEKQVVRMSAASGLAGRLRHDNGKVVLTVSLRRVAPLLQNVEGAVGLRALDPAPA
ncbi:MAG TPA: GNAT family N-acetyltransferase [Nocardioidaceae bacterium]|nr:GNAT family N-acetyltransferase [Nocardioidaceae bacterium]